MNRRLEMLEKGNSQQEVLERLRKEVSLHRRSDRIPFYSLLAGKGDEGQDRVLADGADRDHGAALRRRLCWR
jgi:hypothetical protein